MNILLQFSHDIIDHFFALKRITSNGCTGEQLSKCLYYTRWGNGPATSPKAA